MLELIRGAKLPFLVTLTKGGATFTINPLSTVRAALVNVALQTIEAEIECTNADTGADWPNSLVAALFPSAASALVDLGYSILEIEVIDPDDDEPEKWQFELIRFKEGFMQPVP